MIQQTANIENPSAIVSTDDESQIYPSLDI